MPLLNGFYISRTNLAHSTTQSDRAFRSALLPFNLPRRLSVHLLQRLMFFDERARITMNVQWNYTVYNSPENYTVQLWHLLNLNLIPGTTELVWYAVYSALPNVCVRCVCVFVRILAHIIILKITIVSLAPFSSHLSSLARTFFPLALSYSASHAGCPSHTHNTQHT